ncbi:MULTISPECIES: NUDIX hydrolase [unclassified Rathayibacter]|uniref:NUDIX hydrolase n=1 Tax=unclassified Rathayibacter TaxID=2609250 RepID=UPI00188BE6EF|nr:MULTISPECIES: NUDIX domain-containing protein [unclassified Rathayibacter]MBF4463040.1 NUDIX domain-containing protein [Rathayibacter sp. VKM Ac-2879]MBF4504723.1 NUDIX domain-containing protein [Rathayibacter sp. VKM Ac-2878]
MGIERSDRLADELRGLPDSPLRDDYLAFLREYGAQALDRDLGPEHLTASCFVFSPDLSRVLLCFHGKGRFWVQLGGHIEPADASVAEAAVREAREESGIVALRLLAVAAVDIDRHALGTGFGRCLRHWDVGYAAVADPSEPLVVSQESGDVAWWPVDALPADVPPGFAERVAGVRAAL